MLSSDQKKRIGDRVVECLHGEGIPATSVVVLFQADKSDVYLDGGMVHEVNTPTGQINRAVEYEPRVAALSQGGLEMGKIQRKKLDHGDLKARLALALETQGALSSFEAQVNLGLRDVDGAPAALRRVFAELDADGLISKQGQKRGTRYVWIGQTARFATDGLPKLVKRTSAEGGSPSSDVRDSE
ncbi:MAG: hypothetical protein J0653_04365 [Deltaproteobacteria bacterium]|nr:hypothetical protein [Deltaproteobacteria bacterium]